MLCTKILGSLHDFPGKKIDYVEIEWHERAKKIHRKKSRGGADLAMSFDDDILTRGLRQDDVIGVDGDTVYAVDIPAFEVLVIRGEDRFASCGICWETGNRHTPLFFSDAENEFIVPFDGPLEALFKKTRGVKTSRETRKVDFEKSVSAGVHYHHHA